MNTQRFKSSPGHQQGGSLHQSQPDRTAPQSPSTTPKTSRVRHVAGKPIHPCHAHPIKHRMVDGEPVMQPCPECAS